VFRSLGLGVSILAAIQNLTRGMSQQPALGDPAMNREAGLDNLQRFPGANIKYSVISVKTLDLFFLLSAPRGRPLCMLRTAPALMC